MCVVPSIEIYTNKVLARSDFPELTGYDYFIERRQDYWELSITGREGGCLCEDEDLVGVIYRIVKRLIGLDYSLRYLPNDIREADMQRVQLRLLEAVEKYPPSLRTPPVRVLLS